MKNELQSTELENVAGGKIFETKDGKWIVTNYCKEFSTKEEAEKHNAKIEALERMFSIKKPEHKDKVDK